ncbi:MAG: glycosyltransferase family 4 protein [Verrucomicrobia bacterium]|nr:glycosyltransferase family 4 protein [Verrucomicrobiota bacterium]
MDAGGGWLAYLGDWPSKAGPGLYTERALAMQILITTGIFPPAIGGPATLAPLCGEHLTKAGHRVAVLTQSESLGHDDSRYPFRVLRLPVHVPQWRRVSGTVAAIAREARAADVVLGHGLAIESAFVRKWWCKTPVVSYVHGDLAWEAARLRGWTTDDFETFQRKRHDGRIETMKRLRTFALKTMDQLVAPSQYMKGVIRNWGVPEERIEVIHNPAIPPPGGQAQRRRPNGSGGLNLLSVGRLESWKHYEQVIEAMAPITGARLDLVGEGSEQPRLAALTQKLGLEQRVRFWGRLPNEKVWELFREADVFVHSSQWENFPIIIVEAMLAGVPVIARPIGGIPDQIEDQVSGCLVPGNDAASLRAALERFASLPPERRAAMGERARAVCQERFSSEVVMEKISRLLERCAKRG